MLKLIETAVFLILFEFSTAAAQVSTEDHDFFNNIGMMDSYIERCGSHLHVDQQKLALVHEEFNAKSEGTKGVDAKEAHDMAYEINGDILSDEGLELGCIVAPSVLFRIFGKNSPVGIN